MSALYHRLWLMLCSGQFLPLHAGLCLVIGKSNGEHRTKCRLFARFYRHIPVFCLPFCIVSQHGCTQIQELVLDRVQACSLCHPCLSAFWAATPRLDRALSWVHSILARQGLGTSARHICFVAACSACKGSCKCCKMKEEGCACSGCKLGCGTDMR